MIIEYAQEERRFKNTIQYNKKQRGNNNSENLLDFVPNFTDKEFWIYLLSRVHGSCALKYATEELKSDREIVSIAVRNYAYNLEYAADEFKSDHEIVLTKLLDSFKPQGLANTVLAYAKLGVEAPTLFNAIADVARTKLNEFNPPALANTAWAYAKFKNFNFPLFQKIADVSILKIADFNVQGLSIMLWSFSRGGFDNHEFYPEFIKVFITKICKISVVEFDRESFSQLQHATMNSKKLQVDAKLRKKINWIQSYLLTGEIVE